MLETCLQTDGTFSPPGLPARYRPAAYPVLLPGAGPHGEVITDFDLLTRREIEVLAWIAQGKSDWQVGQILMISRKTVNYHVERVKQKLGVATRMQAALYAERYGLLDMTLPLIAGDVELPMLRVDGEGPATRLTRKLPRNKIVRTDRQQ